MPPRAQNYPNIRGWFSQQMQFCVGGGHDVGFNSAEISAQKLGPACPRPTSLRGPHTSAWLHAAGGGRMQGSHPPWLRLSQEERYRKKEKNQKEENSFPRQNSVCLCSPENTNFLPSGSAAFQNSSLESGWAPLEPKLAACAVLGQEAQVTWKWSTQSQKPVLSCSSGPLQNHQPMHGSIGWENVSSLTLGPVDAPIM